MQQLPTFHSHADQRAVLGSATTVCPKRTPRRYAMQQQREKAMKPPKPKSLGSLQNLIRTRERLAAECRQVRIDRAEQLRALSHMSRSHAAKVLGLSTGIVAHLAREFGLEFGQANAEQIAQLRQLAGRGERINAMADAVSLTPQDVMRLIDDYQIKRGPRMKLD